MHPKTRLLALGVLALAFGLSAVSVSDAQQPPLPPRPTDNQPAPPPNAPPYANQPPPPVNRPSPQRPLPPPPDAAGIAATTHRFRPTLPIPAASANQRKPQIKHTRVPAEWRPVPGQFQLGFTETSSRAERDAVLTTLRQAAVETAETKGLFYHFTVRDSATGNLGSADQVASVIELVVDNPAVEDIFPTYRGLQSHADPNDLRSIS